MIGYLKGQVLDTDGKKAIILTGNGIGYEVNYGYFLSKDVSCELFVHHHKSENDESLWGFNSLIDKKMFELLKTINKIGSSKAYPLISTIGTDGLIQAISFDQPAILSKAPGIGKKMAEQIILTLRDKIDKFHANNIELNNLVEKPRVINDEKIKINIDPNIMNEVLLALDSLGYKDKDVASLVKKQLVNGAVSSADIIKNVLREL